jgi:galactose-1-phosphate uridylyltransferase
VLEQPSHYGSPRYLSPAELEAIIETWMDAKKRYEKEFGK